MNTAQALEWLYATQQFGLKLGLEPIRRLLTELGNPQEAFRSIHVAGTNGKGSVCAMLEQLIRDQGIRTGLFTSPHLIRFNERMQVSGLPISDTEIADGLTRLRALVADWKPHPTFFEISTALAFEFFARHGVEVAVVETGMGGRLDSTNVLRPMVSVLTPIAWDHQEWLGDTLAKIASEKAGILKPGVPAVSALQEPEVRQVLESTGPIEWVDAPLTDVEIGIPGPHQTWNAALAFAALAASGLPWDPMSARESLARVNWPGRFQQLSDGSVLDGAHNPHAARALVAAWRERFGNERVVTIFGMAQDKAIRETLEILETIVSEFHFVPVRSARSADPKALSAWVKRPVTLHASLTEALRATSSNDRRLVTGSLFLIGEMLALHQSATQPPVSDQ